MVDFSYNGPHEMAFLVSHIEVEKNGRARVAYPLPINDGMLEEIAGCLLETDVYMYGAIGSDVDVQSRLENGDTVCQMFGTLIAGKGPLILY